MYKFNTSTLIGNYIKQLLHSFNLPTSKVYTKEQAQYAQEVESIIVDLNLNISKLKTKIERLSKSTNLNDLADLASYQDQYNQLIDTLDYYENHKEKNVIKTIYRSDPEIYPNSLANIQVQYPTIMTYVSYIRNNKLQEYVDGKWVDCHANIMPFGDHDQIHDNGKGYYQIKPYIYNKYDANYTKNLKIDNNIYDSYTHEYLGNYLRFQRDYNGLDLMPLYNCFSDRTCKNLDIKIETNADNNKVNGIFNTDDKNYKIYMVPVKLFKEYTIAMECHSYIEMFVGVYDAYLNTQNANKYKKLHEKTYSFINNLHFNSPQLYTKLVDIQNLLDDDTGDFIADIGQNELNLKLFIKVPTETKTSIVILEGDYTKCSPGLLTNDPKSKKLVRKTNHYVYNYEHIEEYSEFKTLTPLQLLKINTGESYPFADKLVEYLTEHVITHLDNNEDNIQRAKTVINRNNYDIMSNNLWDDKIRYTIYEYMNNVENTEDNNSDILGYIDHVVEKNYRTNFMPILDQTISKYNERHGTQYSLRTLNSLISVPGALAELVSYDPRIAILKNSGFKDETIASIDIYEEGGNK